MKSANYLELESWWLPGFDDAGAEQQRHTDTEHDATPAGPIATELTYVRILPPAIKAWGGTAQKSNTRPAAEVSDPNRPQCSGWETWDSMTGCDKIAQATRTATRGGLERHGAQEPEGLRVYQKDPHISSDRTVRPRNITTKTTKNRQGN